MMYSKFHNKKITTDEGKFDSKYEYEEWCNLKTLEEGGKIFELQRQVQFELIPTIKTTAGTLEKIKYIADFVYLEDNIWKVVDTKGFETDTYKIKKRLFILQYVNPNMVFIERKKGKEDKIYQKSY